MKTFLLTITAVLVSASISIAAGKQGWEDNYAKARELAAKEKKLVLLDFTGSDWCGWCVKLDKEVFSKSDFKSFAKSNLVLVELDFPRGKRLSKKIQEQNNELKAKFAVSGYPTLILVDSEGKVQARWGGYSETFFEELKTKVSTPAKPE